MKRKSIIMLVALAIVVGLVGVLPFVGIFSGAAASAELTDSQLLFALGERLEAAGVDVRAAQVKTDRPHLLSFQIASGGEPFGVAAYRVWREAALAQLAGLPVGWVEVLAFDEEGRMTYGEGNIIEAVQDEAWLTPGSVELEAADSKMRSEVEKAVPPAMSLRGVQVFADAGGYRLAEVSLIGDASTLGEEPFRDFLTTTWVQALDLNKQGAHIAKVEVKVSDNSGRLLLWDINDLQLGQIAGWHSPDFVPSWLPHPAPADSTTTPATVD